MTKKMRKANKKEQVHKNSKLQILFYILEFVVVCAFILFVPTRHRTYNGRYRASLFQTLLNDPDEGIAQIAILIVIAAVYISIRFLKKQI